MVEIIYAILWVSAGFISTMMFGYILNKHYREPPLSRVSVLVLSLMGLFMSVVMLITLAIMMCEIGYKKSKDTTLGEWLSGKITDRR